MDIHESFAAPFQRTEIDRIQPGAVRSRSEVAAERLGNENPASVASDPGARVSQAANLAALTAGLPEVRADKVARVQQALAEGSYSVSSEQVASSVLESLLRR